MNYLGYKYKILPTAEQVELLEQHFGSARFIYNYFLDLKIKLMRNLMLIFLGMTYKS